MLREQFPTLFYCPLHNGVSGRPHAGSVPEGGDQPSTLANATHRAPRRHAHLLVIPWPNLSKLVLP